MRVPRVLTGAGEEGGSRRAERVAGEIAALLSMRLSRSVRDPRLAGVTITRVRMTPDLRTARIWFALLRADEDGEAQKDAARALERAQSFFRHEIATALSLRFVPELQFAFDSDLARARRITTLIRDLEHPIRLGTGGADDEPRSTGAGSGRPRERS